jgi:hypothetical protein
MTNDAIQNTFLEILCTQHQMHYLSMFFLYILRRDRSWTTVHDWFSTSPQFIPSKPTLDTTKPILIPCHVQGSHWIGIVRKLIDNRVHFFYADDLNQSTVETSVRTLLQTQTSKQFYPNNAVWVHCNSITYRPHSNECGPKTLLALTIIGIHPTPSPDILLPFMSPNLAQILRTWIIASLLTGSVAIPNIPHWSPETRLPTDVSVPTYLFPWTNSSVTPHTTTKERPNDGKERKTTKSQHKPKRSRSHPKELNKNLPPASPQSNPTAPKPTVSTIDHTAKNGNRVKTIQTTLYDAYNITPIHQPNDYQETWGHFPDSISNNNTLRIVFSNP